ncbi:hypothetical protein [Aeromicrobium sp.]
MRKTEMSIEQVQHWVISLLIFAISAFPTGGLIGVSYAVYNQGRHGAATGLLVMTGVIGVLAVGAMRVVHKRSVATPLLLLGILPAAIAAYVIVR